jgi:hypothetical protein
MTSQPRGTRIVTSKRAVGLVEDSASVVVGGSVAQPRSPSHDRIGKNEPSRIDSPLLEMRS